MDRMIWKDVDGYTVELRGEKLVLGGKQEMELWRIDEMIKPVAAALKKMGKNPNDYFVVSGYPVRNGAKSAVAAALIEVQQMREQQRADAKAALLAAIPGLDKLEAAIEDEARYDRQFDRMMEDEGNDGARPPRPVRVSREAVVRQYPRAAAYLKAKRYAESSPATDYGYYARKAGEVAVGRLLAGEDHIPVMAELEAAISEAVKGVD